MPSRFGSVALVIVGIIFLLHNLNVLSFRMIGDVLRTWWPLILILVGVLGLIGKKAK
jgi:lia operon protein LiaF